MSCRNKLLSLTSAFNQLKLEKKRQEEDFAAQEMEQLTSKVDGTAPRASYLCGSPAATVCVCT